VDSAGELGNRSVWVSEALSAACRNGKYRKPAPTIAGAGVPS
jgi:hypothetical protein